MTQIAVGHVTGMYFLVDAWGHIGPWEFETRAAAEFFRSWLVAMRYVTD